MLPIRQLADEKSLIIETRLLIIGEGDRVKKKMSKFKSIKELCEYHYITRKTFYKWFNRWRESNKDTNSLLDRSSAPKNTRKLNKILERTIIRIRDKLGWSSLRIHIELKRRAIVNPDTGKPISESCIRNVFDRYKRGYKYDKQKKIKLPIERYEKDYPGELGHIDTKKLKNIKGTDPNKKKYQFALVDDATRIPYVEILPNKQSKTSACFLNRATKWFNETFDITFESILSDNGKEYTFHTEKGRKHHSFEVMMKKLDIKHSYTRIRRPQTNGKVERFFKTLDLELHNRIKFHSYKHRNMELKKYLNQFIYSRFHMGIKGMTPYERFLETNLESNSNENEIKNAA